MCSTTRIPFLTTAWAASQPPTCLIRVGCLLLLCRPRTCEWNRPRFAPRPPVSQKYRVKIAWAKFSNLGMTSLPDRTLLKPSQNYEKSLFLTHRLVRFYSSYFFTNTILIATIITTRCYFVLFLYAWCPTCKSRVHVAKPREFESFFSHLYSAQKEPFCNKHNILHFYKPTFPFCDTHSVEKYLTRHRNKTCAEWIINYSHKTLL